MNRRIVRRITLWLTLGLAILGCATPALVTPPPVTSAPGSLETFIVETGIAAQTETAIVLPPSPTPSLTSAPPKTPTITPTATATVLFLFPTSINPTDAFMTSDIADFMTAEASTNDNSHDGYVKPTATPSEWECRVLYKSPAKDAVLIAGTSFKAIWTVQNTGTKVWPKKGVDVVYQSGARLNPGRPYYDIPAGVGPGGTVTISVTMELPKRPKGYNMRWALMVGRTQFCSVQFVFEAR
jgi:Ig-like domain from next to BRCA1 gene